MWVLSPLAPLTPLLASWQGPRVRLLDPHLDSGAGCAAGQGAEPAARTEASVSATVSPACLSVLTQTW